MTIRNSNQESGMNGGKRARLRIALGVMAMAGTMISCSSKPIPEAAPAGLGPVSAADMPKMKVDGYTMGAAKNCTGYLDRADPLPEAGSFLIAGWAYLPLTKTKPAKVIIASADGKVLATAPVATPRPDVKQSVAGTAVLDTGYSARVAVPAHTNVRAFALLDDGKSVCALYDEFKQP